MNTSVSSSTPSDATPLATKREWIGLAILMLPTMLISMDMTVLHLAVPSLSTDLQPSSSQLLWITDIYGFMIAGFLITMGTVGDRIGRRRLLLVGAAAFGVASALAAFSTTPQMLIATRALLGIAGATLMPSTMSLIRTMFLNPTQRTAAIGVWVSGFSVGAVIGPVVGGVLLEYFWWGSVFLIGVPVMVLLLAVGPLLLPEYRNSDAGRFDFTSVFLSLAAVLLVIYGLKRVAVNGLDWLPVLAVVVSIVLGAVFLRRQRTLADPLVDLHLFRTAEFSASLTTYTLSIFFSFGLFLFIAQYLQLVVGLSPLQAGLWLAPGSLAFIVGSNLTPRFVHRVRPVYVVMGGLVLAALGIGMLTQIDLDAVALVVAANIIMSLGFSGMITLTVDMVVSAAPPARAGSASALAETGAELGGALGLAVLGSVGIALYRNQMAANLPPDLAPGVVEGVLETLGGAVVTANQLASPTGALLLVRAQEAFVYGFQVNAWISMVGLVGLIGLVMVMLRHVQPHLEAHAEPADVPDIAGEILSAEQQPQMQMGD
jgi:MFS transporter, DHA2 family, multidrug resistance protein